MIVITGAAGFIGSAMAWKLNTRGRDDLLLVDRLGTDDRWKNLRALRFKELASPEAFIERFEHGRFLDPITAVIHLGACSATTERDADFLMENNVRYAQRIAMACIDRGIRLIHASSAATYGNGEQGYDDDPESLHTLRPLNMYGYSKQLFDLWAYRERHFGRLVSLKFFNVYGPNEYHKGDMASLVRKAVDQINATGVLKLFKSYRPEYADGGQQRDFVYIKDVVDAMAWLVEHPGVGGILNIGGGVARSWNDLAHAVFAAMDRPTRIEYIEMPETIRNQYQYYTQAPLNRLRNAGYSRPFTSLEAGIDDYVRNYLLAGNAYLEPKP